MTRTLGEIASVVRSKNAGPFHYTFDVMFADEQTFQHLKETNQITHERFAETYRLPLEDVLWTVYEPGRAFKATVRRPAACGDPDDGDVYGCQQHAPLLEWELDL
jgi:hypothetical protein